MAVNSIFVDEPEASGAFDPLEAEAAETGPQYSTHELWYRSNIALLAARRSLGENSPLIQDLLAGFEAGIANGAEPSINTAVDRNRKAELKSTAEAIIGEEAFKEVTEEQQELLRGTLEVFQRVDSLEEDEFAIDKAAGEELVQSAVKDPIVAAALEDTEAFGTVMDRFETLYIKMNMMQKAINIATKDRQDQSFVWDVADFIASFIPHPTEQATAGAVGEGVASLLDPAGSLLTAQNVLFSDAVGLEEFQALLPTVIEELKDASAFLGGENRTLVERGLRQLNSMSSKGLVTHNILRGLEVATLPLIATTKVLTRGAVSAARVVGNRAAGRKLVSSTVAGNQTGRTANSVGVTEAMDNMMPTGMGATEDLLGGPNLSGEVARVLEQNRAVQAEILATTTPQSLSAEAGQAAATRAFAGVRAEFPKDVLTDFDIVVNPVTKTRDLVAHIGQIGGEGGFVTEKAARAEAARRGFERVGVTSADGQFFIEARRPITEAGIADAFKLEDIPFSSSPRMYLSGADTLLPKTIRGATHLATDVRARLTRSVQQLQKNMKGLSGKDRRRLTVAIDESEVRGEWLSGSELKQLYRDRFQREITDRELIGYGTYKDINDVEWYIRNSAEYAKRQRSGVESITIEAPDFAIPHQNARVITGAPNAPETRYWTKTNGSNQIETFRPGEMDAAQIADLVEKQGYRVIQLEKSFVKDGVPIEWVLARGENLEARSLDLMQLNYRAGGHRMYEGQWFIKQSVIRAGDQGRKLVMNPRTYHVFTSPSAARAYTRQLEQARLAYTRAVSGEISEGAATKEIQEAGIGVSSFDELDDLVKTEKFEADTPFETLFDRDSPAATREATNEFQAYQASNPDLEGVSGWYADTGRMYYSGKGTHLRDPQGDLSPVIDPFRASQLAIENATRMRAFGDYRTRAVASWLKTFGGHIDVNPNIGSDVQRFLQANVVTSNTRIAAKAEGVRLTLKRMLGMPTKDSELMQDGMRRLGEFLDRAPGGTKLGRIAMNHQDSNPVQALKSFAFDLYLGLGDISQLLIQPMTVAASISVSPKLGFAGFAAMPWLRMTMRNTNDDFLNLIAKRQGMTGTGLSPDEFKAMVGDLQASGKGEISGELAMLDSFSNPQVGWWGARGAKRARDLGRLPYFEAERVNRLTSYAMAWREFHQLNPKARIGELSLEGKEFIAKRTNDFSLSMTSASSAWWQRGVLSVPTQFMSYQARMIEAMLPKFAGGSDAFSSAQKFRLVAGQVLLFGAMGVPAGPWALEQFQNATGTVLDPDQYRMATSGLIDSMIWNASGGDLNSNWASRAGMWGQGGGMIADMFADDRSFAEVVGGPVIQVLSDTHEAMWKLASIARAESVTTGELTAEALNKLAQLGSSWSRYSRAKYIWDHGVYLSRKGILDPGVRATKMEALATALGVPLRQVNDIYSMQDDISTQEQSWRDMAKMMANLRNLALVEPENVDQYTRTIQGIFASLPAKDRAEIISRAGRLVPRDRYVDAFKRYMKTIGERDAASESRAAFSRQFLRNRIEGE